MRHEFPTDYNATDLHRVIDSPHRTLQDKQIAEFELNHRSYKLMQELEPVNIKWQQENGE